MTLFLSTHFPLINRLHNIIPNDKLINHEIISALTEDDIFSLQIYMHYTFPEVLSNYDALINFIEGCRNIHNNIPKGSVIIAPGDSPSRVCHLLNLLYNDKSYQILNFPLSSSYSKTNPILIDSYLKTIIKEYNNLVYLDYVGSGRTYRLINNSLIRLSENITLKFPSMNIADYIDIGELFTCLVSSAENINARALPIYKLEYSYNPINIFRANAIVTYLYLIAQNKIRLQPFENSQYNFGCEDIYRVQYYDVKECIFIEKIAAIDRHPINESRIKLLFLTGETECISINTFVSIERLYHNFPSIDFSTKKGLVKIKLINNVELTGYYDGISLDIGDGNGSRNYNPFITNIDVIDDRLNLVDIRPKNLYEMEYYDNGVKRIKSIYCTMNYCGVIGYIQEKDFILKRRPSNTSWVSLFLIIKVNKQEQNMSHSINGIGILQYYENKSLQKKYDNWVTNDCYYETIDGTLSIIKSSALTFDPV